jgi:hypothetical protein
MMQKCIICGATTEFRFAARDYVRPEDRKEYRVYWCRFCDFGRLQGSFTSEQISAFYPADYYTHGHVSEVAKPSFFERLRVRAAWQFDNGKQFNPGELPIRNGTACDIGCGNGDNLKLFHDAGFTTTGFDPDISALAACPGSASVFKESRFRKSAQDDKWSFCLTVGTLCPANQERP